MTNRWMPRTVIVLCVVLAGGCATSSAFRSGQQAAARGDWDAAVAHYREVLARDPQRTDARIQLERAMRMAAAEHAKRARDLEEQDQLPGAMAEYKLAAEFDPSNTYYITRALQVERTLNDRLAASRQPDRMDVMRQQAAETSPFPRLDPRSPVVGNFQNAAVRDILMVISKTTGIQITYDRGADAQLGQAFPIDIQGEPIESVLNQILSQFTLTYKVTGPRSIFIYPDTAQKRNQYDDLYEQTFYIEHADMAEIQQVIQQFTQGGTGVRPIVQPMKNANALSVKATAQVLQMIDRIIRANDKPRAEVVIDVEILEVNRNNVKELGIDLSQYALGFQLSPEVAPPNTAATPGIPPMPPPINLNTLRSGISGSDVFVTIPSALIKALETDSKTRLLARPQMRGREGATLVLNLGEEVPIPTSSIPTFNNQVINQGPTTTFQYKPVGVNLTVTPRVTYSDEIILENLIVQRSALGGNIVVGGTSSPIIIQRSASTTIRLRNGESNLLAGLVRDEERKGKNGFVGVSQVPVLGWLFGTSRDEIDQSDIVMIITPYIVRGHEVTVEDLRPRFVGTQLNPGVGATPGLLAPDAPPPPTLAAPGTGQPVAPGAAAPPGGVTTGAGQPPPVATPPRAPGVVPIVPVGGEAQPAAPAAAQLRLTPAGTEHPQGNVFAAPISASNLSGVGTLTITLTYNPAILRATNVTQGQFMGFGGVTATFAPKIDPQAGRVDIAISRPTDQPGATTVESALVAAVNFQAVGAGTTSVTMTVVAMTPGGQPIQVQAAPVTITVK